MKLILFILSYSISYQGEGYYVISNRSTDVGVEYCSKEEVKCFIETRQFNYFESCLECYKNAEFITF